MGQALYTGSPRQRSGILAGCSERFLEPGGRACAVPITVAESVAKVQLRKCSEAGEEEASAAAGLRGSWRHGPPALHAGPGA